MDNAFITSALLGLTLTGIIYGTTTTLLVMRGFDLRHRSLALWAAEAVVAGTLFSAITIVLYALSLVLS